MQPTTDKKFLFFMIALSLAGMSMAVLASSRYGIGVAGDSVRYLSIAENILHGKGFFDYDNQPLTWWPPLYPLTLAGVAFLTQSSPFQAGSWINMLMYGLNIFLSGIFFEKTFRNSWGTFKYLGSLFIVLSVPFLRLHEVILSDPLYIFFMLLFFLAATRYLENGSYRAFWAMALLAMLASLQRYLGISQVLAGGLLVLLHNRKTPLRVLRDGAVFGLVSFGPLAAWLYFHNYLQYGTTRGLALGDSDPLANLQLSWIKIVHWFIPYFPGMLQIVSQSLLWIGLIVLILLLLNRKPDWRAWSVSLTSLEMLPATLFSAIYLIGTALTAITDDTKILDSDRYYIVIIAPILAVLWITLDKLVISHLKIERRWLEMGLVGVFALWSIYPLYNLTQYIAAFRLNGEPTYNIYNSRYFHDSQTLKEAITLIEAQPNARFYSNLPPALWYFAGIRPNNLPAYRDYKRSEMKDALAGWPGEDGQAYIIWFLPDAMEFFASPEYLARVADETLVYQGPDGAIYSVSPRPAP